MELTASSAASIHEALSKLIALYSGDEEYQLLSTDFYLQPLREEGRLALYDDNDEVIVTADVPEWTGYAPESFYDKVAADLNAAIEAVNTEGDLERLAVWMPYSFVLVDEERETITDLLLVDEDKLLVKKGLMVGLDEELNKFIADLLSE